MRFKFFALIAFSFLTSVSLAAQEVTTKSPNVAPTPEKKEKKQDTKQTADSSKNATAEQVAEATVFVYGSLGGFTNADEVPRYAIKSKRLLTEV